MTASAHPSTPSGDPADFRLRSGSEIGVVGGGPAGSFFSIFALQLARRAGIELKVTVFEPRDYTCSGAKSCNMCGGIISESLMLNLFAEGIRLPPAVIQKRIDSYFLHMDVGSVRIETPLKEKRIAAVYRGGGPRGSEDLALASFDGHLLDMATGMGARRAPERVADIVLEDGRPRVTTDSGTSARFDLLVGACGINGPTAQLFEKINPAYHAPKSTRAYICEFQLGPDMIRRYFGSSMHVFLLDIPRLEFAAMIPKRDYVTVCLLGEDIDKNLVQAFLDSPEVRKCMPPHWQAPDRYCQCFPRINIDPGVQAYGDRLLMLGDCGVTRLFKDGIGAAYRVAKAAATTVVFSGVSADDFRRRFAPACRRISGDNRIGRLVFSATRLIQKSRIARRAVWRMVSKEQNKDGRKRRMSLVLWDTFTGSAPYRAILSRTTHPAFALRLTGELLAALRREERPPTRRVKMATGASGLIGKLYKDGDVIYHQGDRGDCMYVVQGGEVEIVQRKEDKEYCLAVLGDGDFFGERGLFAEETRSATVRARGDVWVFTLEKQTLLRRIHEDPSLAFRMIEKMSHRIRELEAALVRQASAPT